MICPVCRLELGVERREGELVLTYSVGDWRVRCANVDRGGPVLCSSLRSALLTQLTEGKVTLLRKPKPQNGPN